jgi:hypothetical protein
MKNFKSLALVFAAAIIALGVNAQASSTKAKPAAKKTEAKKPAAKTDAKKPAAKTDSKKSSK